MNPQTPITEATAKPKKGGKQPRHHAPKTRVASALRRKRIIKAILDGKSATQAGIDSGLSPKTAPAQVNAILKEPEVRSTLLAAMVKFGINDDYLALQHKNLIEGKKLVPARGSDCETDPYIEVPDNQARARGLELAYRIMGRFIDKHEIDIKRPVQIVIRKFCSRG